MRATEVLQKCLSDALDPMHALRRRVLLRAVEAMLRGRRLTLIDLARAWPDAERVRAPLKALDRLLGNRHLQGERYVVYRVMTRWLVRHRQPVVVIDWSDLKPDGSWHLLRAAIPVGGRAVPILDMVFPRSQQGARKAEGQFLQRLAQVLPNDACPILVTDAGFRTPWFRAVEAMGWHWLGRLRGTTYLKPVEVPDEPSQWITCKALYALVRRTPRDLGAMEAVRDRPLVAHVVLHAKPARGRKHRNRRGLPARDSKSRKNARRESEPWLLMASPSLHLNARQLVTLYARRMQIELSFRDLKSHRYGQAFEDSLTRIGARIAVLLLISTLAAFAAWLAGLACEASGIDRWLAPHRSKRRLYSVMRLGREALVRRWLTQASARIIACLRTPGPALIAQLDIPA